MSEEQTIEQRVRAYYAAVSARDIDACAAMFAPNAEMRDPVGLPAATTDTDRRARYERIAAAFERFVIEPSTVIAGGSEAAATWAVHARTPSGTDVEFSGISTFEFDVAGSIARMSAYFDLAAVAKAVAG